ncbi:MAG: DUF2723 domain-containing protein [Bacteroidaceae bacterium]|nr:DUF2723 domain-containing protein [Bacteroidaceae bacterium]
MKRFKLLNNTFGWLTFIIAAVTYCLTVEPTASFWDCPEFILSGNKLEVGHPPGAPFFMLAANFFSLFAAPGNVAYMVNIMSALMSAAGILFLFWSITHLTRKLIVGNSREITGAQTITILASGLVGALAYTWSDTYWFSAVEGEVYSFSSLFTAVVFWLILKWEDNADSPHSDRWLILIAYLVGLSIGVHLLNLLCIPAIVLVVYYKKFPGKNWKYTLLALAVSAILVAIVLYGIVPGVVKVGGWFELLFVNVFGMPFNTGLYVYLILLFGTLAAGIICTEKFKAQTTKAQKTVSAILVASVALLGIPFYGHNVTFSVIIGIIALAALAFVTMLKKSSNESNGTKSGIIRSTKSYLVSFRAFNTIFLSLMFIMIGYSSYALIVIRSSANTPMDQNSPEDIFTLGTYLNREQYGTRPLFYGYSFGSEIMYDENGRAKSIDTSPVYTRDYEKGEYRILEYNKEYLRAQNMLFPRMYSSDHKDHYEKWVGHKIRNTVPSQYRSGRVTMPTQLDNLAFFINYQVNHMYWRYFLWNFVGRQNDIQSHGEREHGNWITGIGYLDELRLGNLDELPESLKSNKGRNVFFALPLILGIIGLIWQAKRGEEGKRQLLIVGMLFFMTGLAIVLYLNQTPMQPRERDYAYAASFYAFTIWIGMAVAGIVEFIEKRTKKESIVLNAIVSVVCLLVPVQMVSQTWDDHDRSGRYACRDFGQNYLKTLPDNCSPIIFTCGDNDTFPLWYNQEVEGERTDARVCNLSYIQADWYIDQMKRPAYESPALPISLEREDYHGDTNQLTFIIPDLGTRHIKEFLSRNPEKAALIGDIHDVRNITKYWIAEANDKEKSEARKVVDEILTYIKPKILADGERLIQLARNSSMDNEEERNMASYQDSYGRIMLRVGEELSPGKAIIPTGMMRIPLDSAAIVRSGLKIPRIFKENGIMPEYMEIDMTEMTAIYRHELLILDMLANANWERPLYMAITVGSDNYPEVLQDFFVLEGLAYRITPFNWTQIAELSSQTGIYDYPVDTEKFYNNVMDRFKWGGIKENKDYYADETIHRMVSTHRTQIATLAQYMHNDMILAESDNDSTKVLDLTRKVIMLLDRYSTELPGDIVRHDPLRDGTLEIAKTYKNLYLRQKEAAGTELFLGEDTLEMLKENCQKTASIVVKSEYEYLNWYNTLRPRERNKIIEEHRTKQLLEGVQAMLVDEEESEDSLREKFDNYVGHSLDKVYDILISSQKELR